MSETGRRAQWVTRDDLARASRDLCPFEGCSGGVNGHWKSGPKVRDVLHCIDGELWCCPDHESMLAMMEGEIK